MSPSIKPTLTLIGDSVTDCNRDRDDRLALGNGWARLVAEALPAETVGNRGISGNRVRDLAARWQVDVIAERTSALAILVGINDTLRRYDSRDPTTTDAFVDGYRALVRQARNAGIGRIILLEPFLLPISDEQWQMREDLDPKITGIRWIAYSEGCELIPTDGILNAAAARAAPGALAADGVHPTPRGHELIAEAFLSRFVDRV